MQHLSESEKLTCQWHLKYRLPSGMLVGQDKTGRPITVFPSPYMSKRLYYATSLVQKFKNEFDVASIYGKTKTGQDLGEIARFDKVLRKFVLV